MNVCIYAKYAYVPTPATRGEARAKPGSNPKPKHVKDKRAKHTHGVRRRIKQNQEE